MQNKQAVIYCRVGTYKQKQDGKSSVRPLLDITDAEFEVHYNMGVWWAMYGNRQGKGVFDDDYLIENVRRNIQAGRYSNTSSSWLQTSGFYFGMLHGGWLVSKPDTLVNLIDPNFTKGYQDGQKCKNRVTDTEIISLLHTWAHNCRGKQALCYLLGRLIGTLSLTLKQAPMSVTG